MVFAFFGVGNIASINSFDVKVVLPFISIFNPFIMGGLLAYKVSFPLSAWLFSLDISENNNIKVLVLNFPALVEYV